MRIAFDTCIYSITPRGGIVRIFDELLNHLATKPEAECLLYAREPFARRPPLGPRSRLFQFPITPPAVRRFAPGRWLESRLEHRCWTRTMRPDLFHTTFYRSQAVLPRAPVVVHVYDLTHELLDTPDDMPRPDQFVAIKRAGIASAAKLLCISEATRADLLRCYPDTDPARTEVVYCGWNPQFRRMDPQQAEEIVRRRAPALTRPFLLYIGSRQRYKNFHRLVQGYGTWRGRHDVDLAVVGAPKSLWEHALVDDLGRAAERVKFLGPVEDDLLCALYNRARCFVYPSLSEGFGIPVLESLAAGCPVCISDIPVFHEVAGSYATYFDPLSTDSIQAALDRALTQRNDPRRVPPDLSPFAKFSWEKSSERIWQIYRELTQ